MRQWLFTIVMAVIVPLSAGLAAPSGPLKVAVSIPPQKYFVERIGGSRVKVTVMVPPGADPHTFEPKPRQLADLSEVSLYFAVGMTFEDAWLDRFLSVNRNLTIVHTESGIKKRPMTGHEHHDDGDVHGHEKEHGSDDPHTWLSPRYALVEAQNIFAALVKADPENAKQYAKGFNALAGDIKKLDDELTTVFAGSKGKAFMVFHPSWGYFADAYGLVQMPVEVEGREPGPADLARLITFAKERQITAILIQPQFSEKSARTIADAVKGSIVVADPLAEAWLDNLRDAGRKIAAALR